MAINRKARPYKARDLHSIEDAFVHALGVLTPPQVVQILGKAQSTLYAIADPDQPTKQLRLSDAEKLDLAMVEAGYEPSNLLAYQARIEAAQTGHQPTGIRHIEWALMQLVQASLALQTSGLGPDERRVARRTLNKIIGHAAEMAVEIDDAEPKA